MVTKVEPPNWWPDHSLNPIQLLIHGSGLQSASVRPSGGLVAGPVRTNDAGTWLFVDIAVPRGTRPGNYPIEIGTSEGKVAAPFRLDTPLDPTERFRGFSSNDVIYLIMPDRFANGDPANDDPAISHGLFDRKNSRCYHGGDLQGVIDHLPYLKALGVTAIWLTPIYDNVNQSQVSGSQCVTDYHGYGAVDYYGVEEHFGTLELLRKLVDQAHRTGIKVIQDQVANHVGPNHPWVNDPPKPTWFHGTLAHHVDENWQIWILPDPHASDLLKRQVLDGWFANMLPDLNQEDADVARYEIQNALWWVGVAGFDGIRQDTLPYVSRAFWRDWSAALHTQYPALRVVGEVFDGDAAVTSFFQGGRTRSDWINSGIDSVFDFPTYFNIRDVFAGEKPLQTLSQTLAKDRLYPSPDALVTFLGNHDVMRFMSEPGATHQKLKLAFTYLLTMRGAPCIYYGDEIGMRGNNDPDNRRDFPGGWKGDPRNAFEASGRTAAEQDIFSHVQKLTALRAKLEPLRQGKMAELSIDKQIWVFARESPSGSVIVAFNNEQKAIDIPLSFRDGDYIGQLGTGKELRFRNGLARLTLAAHSAEIFAQTENSR